MTWKKVSGSCRNLSQTLRAPQPIRPETLSVPMHFVLQEPAQRLTRQRMLQAISEPAFAISWASHVPA